jgi:WD40 repeat protein
LRGHQSDVTSVAFSPDGEFVASGDWSGTIKVWGKASQEDVLRDAKSDRKAE